ncbi:MAG: hypothetical protein AAF138_11660 [Planctomycetota bacterium]
MHSSGANPNPQTPSDGSGRGYALDIIAGDAPATPASGVAGSRPFIGVYFACSKRYVRVLRDVRRTEYLARCPSCGKTKRFQVGSGGSNRRIFELTCR